MILILKLLTSKKQPKVGNISFTQQGLHIPPFLRDIIINFIDKYYNNGLVDDIKESCSNKYQK